MEDAEAIRECGKGDTGAFRYIVERYQQQALGHATAILGNRADAQDAVQDAFVDVYRTLARFEYGRRFYPWFYTILRNRCWKALRDRRNESASVEGAEIAVEPASDQALNVVAALGRLNPEDREILTLRHMDGLSYAELSERLGIPKGTVMSRLFHARTRLREKAGIVR